MTWLQYLIPQHLLSKLMFGFARIKNKPIKNTFTRWFVKTYQVNLSEAERENIEDYQSFNDFFTRKLKKGARIIGDSSIISPVDGVVSQTGVIKNLQILQAKNHHYSLQALLGDEQKSQEFEDGQFVTVYLSPKDYHRIHMPYDGVLKSMTYIPGDLFSVNKKTAQNVNNLFARNERVVCYFQTKFGLCAFVMVGAIFVGSIQTKWQGVITPPYKKQAQNFDYEHVIKFKKGDEIARFNMGSTVIMLMPKSSDKFCLKEFDIVKTGQSLGRL